MILISSRSPAPTRGAQHFTGNFEQLWQSGLTGFSCLQAARDVRAFYSDYELGNYDEIILRFGLKNQTQIPFLYGYIEHMIDAFLSQGSDYKNIALGSLMQRSINNTYSLI